MKRAPLLCLLLLAAFVPGAGAVATVAQGGPGMVVGTVDDIVKQDTPAAAKAKMDLLKAAGFDAVRISSIWAPGLTAPGAEEQRQLANVASAARADGMRVYVAVYNFGSKTTPLTAADQDAFAAYAAAVARQNPSFRDFIVGNEPNLNRFWLPQFGPDGGDVAAPAYETLLAKTYDALKTVDPKLNVIGVAVSPRGIDRPGTGRDTHSPTVFLADLGAAYRASGRTKPIMDQLGINVYGENSSTPPSFAHPNTTPIGLADYAKLVALLGKAFDGTAQPGSTLPIFYGEYGVETRIPPDKAKLYTGTEPSTTKPVDEATQASYYHDAMAIAFCQPNVTGILLLHAVDEPALDRWQSGVYYADGTPKASLAGVRDAARAVRGGVIAKCQGLEITPTATVSYPRGAALRKLPLTLKVRCDVDCNYLARLEKLPAHSTTLAVSGKAQAGVLTTIALPKRRVAPGRYRFTLRLTAPVNVGPPARLASPPVSIP